MSSQSVLLIRNVYGNIKIAIINMDTKVEVKFFSIKTIIKSAENNKMKDEMK